MDFSSDSDSTTPLVAFKTLVSVTNPDANRPSSVTRNDTRSFHNFSVRNGTLIWATSILIACFTSNTLYSQQAFHYQKLNMSTVLHNLQSRNKKKSEWKCKRFSVKEPDVFFIYYKLSEMVCNKMVSSNYSSASFCFSEIFQT